MRAVFVLCRDKTARLADRPCPHRPVGGPIQEASRAAAGKAAAGNWRNLMARRMVARTKPPGAK